MKYKEEKVHYGSGQIKRHYFLDESGKTCGENWSYHESGQLKWHYINRNDKDYGEVKAFNSDGTLRHHCLKDGKGNKLATVIKYDMPSTHSEEQLIEIAKEHNLPLLSDLPKTEAERTHWNLKWPDLPLLPIPSK